MYIRRYYMKGLNYDKTYSNEFFTKLIETKGIKYALSIDNAYYEIIFEDREERKEYIIESRNRVINNIRWYLDNLDNIPTITSSQTVYDKNINCFTIDGRKVTDWALKPKTL